MERVVRIPSAPLRVLLLVLLCGAALSADAASPAEAWRMGLVGSSNAVCVRITSPEIVNDDLLKLLRSGVSVSLKYQFELYAVSVFPLYIFPQRTVTWTKTLEYDVAAAVYVLTTPAGVIKDDSLRDILDLFYRPDLVRLDLGSPAEFRGRFWTRGRARFETIKLYPPLSLIFGLIDIYNFTTPWMTPAPEAQR